MPKKKTTAPASTSPRPPTPAQAPASKSDVPPRERVAPPPPDSAVQPNSSRRPTQKDIANHARVTQATVSLALSNHPGISAETRRQVMEAAEALGYVPDPYLSGLSAYRKRIRAANFQGTLAWISNYPPRETWKRWPLFKSYYEGARDRATSLGYNLEEHDLNAEGMTKARLRKILIARNILGLLIAPQPAPNMRLDFDFTGFASVTFGYSLVEPELHVVTMQQFRSMEIVFRKLVALGYRRPGLAMPVNSDQRSDRNWSAAFWSEQRTLPARDRIPLLLPEVLTVDGVRKWITRHRPDVVVSISRSAYDIIAKIGL
ncbi:MAG TPA: LacI family DNA-binding transcriptional regulator, partial [Candidatus Methylacidiphilales bacterium]|nr:LacI family DNA-binding transcriptional regulator [Candidatus Methylacidiphilales bacterium]